ncbi:uncharacterized protein LOC117409187 isoform X2 [Acipenser ruthenus]|uniref:uncharacterized protein LOC117409187 isoform X2 n=1 Tax=Acipenser ruthenus TaxID=7906 RepID=UPI0027415F50|nr:uncharacterized protein LOC117409187 isoform X2 [Acipenser ruthenus]
MGIMELFAGCRGASRSLRRSGPSAMQFFLLFSCFFVAGIFPSQISAEHGETETYSELRSKGKVAIEQVQGEEYDPIEQVQGEEYDPIAQVQGEEYGPIEQAQGEEHDPIEQGEEYDPIEQGEEHDPIEQVQGEKHDPIEKVQGEAHDPIEQVQGEEHDLIEQGEEYDPIEQGEEHDPIVQGEEHDPIVQGEEHDPIVQGEEHDPIVQDEEHDPIVQGEEHDPIVQGEEHDPIVQGEEHDPIVQGEEHDPIVQGEEHDPIVQGEEHDPIVQGEEHDPIVQGEEHDPIVQGEEHDPIVQGEEHDPIVQGEEHDPIEQGEEHDPIEQVQGEEHDPIEQGEEHDPIEQGEEHDPIEQGEEHDPIEQVEKEIHSEENVPVQPPIQRRPYPVKFIPPYGIPVPVTPFPFKLLSPRVIPVNAPVPPELQRVMYPKPVPMPRPLPISLAAAVRVLCSENKMYVRVRTDLYGFKCKAGQLTLGTNCRSNGVSGGYLLFTYGLKECGSQVSVEAGQLVYKNVLKYVPSVQNSTIRRSMPFTVPLQCRYYRYHHVYRHGIRPHWRNPTRFKSLKTPYGFALKIINGDWVPERMMNTFYLGQPIHFQATTNLTIPGTKLFIHRCYATASPASNSTPRYTVIENYGCMVDSKYETCSSHFVPPRTNNTINLIVDAFQFNTLSPLVNKYYMHCTMVVTSNSMVTQSTKSCHYDKNVNRWVELEGNHSVCSCCDSVCINEDVTLPIVTKSTISSDALLVLEKQGGDDGERKTGAAILELEEDLLSYEGVSKEDREALSPEDDAFDENDYNRLLDVEAEGNDNSDDPNQHLEDTFDASKVPEHSDTENYEGAGEPGHFGEADEWRALSAEEAGGN